MKKLVKALPWLFLALFVTEMVAVLMPKKDGDFHTRDFGRLPALLEGRIQPFDTVAHNALLQIRSTSDVPLELVPSWKFWHHPEKLKSTEWLLEVMFRPEVADTRWIFLLHHPDIISELKLGDKGIEKSGLRYYTYNELEPALDEIEQQGKKAAEVQKEEQRTTYQRQILKLANAVMLYQRLKNSIQPQNTSDFTALIENFKASWPAGIAAFRAQQAGEKFDEDLLRRFARTAQAFNAVAGLAYPLTVPPINPEPDRHAWENVGTSLMDSIQRGGEVHPAVGYFARMATAYSHTNAADFNSAVAGYKNWLEPKYGKEASKGRAEYYFNQIKIFLHGMIIYLFAFVLAGGALLTFESWPNLSESLRKSAFYLILFAFIVHTFGLLFRMALEGRPPVTNLYSSAIFIGWGACVLGIFLERTYRVGIGSAVAGIAGFFALLIAHNLALGGDDTMKMLQAVLDTNVWLATHVVIVTLGYASTFVAGLLGILYILLGLFSKTLTRQLSQRASAAVGAAAGVGVMAITGGVAGIAAGNAIGTRAAKSATEGNLGKALAKMTYAILCFATLFSFVGTVLGGIWADQSWGRFWGWDPKENGALIIVLWNALILHARWGGLVRERGLMVLAVFGNIVTSFSWFGTNMLGIGLHSYGFMAAGFKWLMLFIASQLAIMFLAQLPLKKWKSFQTAEAPAKASPAPA